MSPPLVLAGLMRCHLKGPEGSPGIEDDSWERLALLWAVFPPTPGAPNQCARPLALKVCHQV